MLMVQSEPKPEEVECRPHTGKMMSIVPSRSKLSYSHESDPFDLTKNSERRAKYERACVEERARDWTHPYPQMKAVRLLLADHSSFRGYIQLDLDSAIFGYSAGSIWVHYSEARGLIISTTYRVIGPSTASLTGNTVPINIDESARMGIAEGASLPSILEWSCVTADQLTGWRSSILCAVWTERTARNLYRCFSILSDLVLLLRPRSRRKKNLPHWDKPGLKVSLSHRRQRSSPARGWRAVDPNFVLLTCQSHVSLGFLTLEYFFGRDEGPDQACGSALCDEE